MAHGVHDLSFDRAPGDNYFLEPGGHVIHGAPRGPHQRLAELYARLVDDTAVREPELGRVVEGLFSQLKLHAPVVKDVRITVRRAAGEPDDELAFDYQYNNGRPHLMQRINFRQPDRSAWDRVHAVAYSFEKVLSGAEGSLPGADCIALVRGANDDTGAGTKQLRLLEQVANVVEVSEPKTALSNLGHLLAA